jgi:hypothetical protein
LPLTPRYGDFNDDLRLMERTAFLFALRSKMSFRDAEFY